MREIGVLKNKLYRNIIISFATQLISLSISFIFGFLVPKTIDEYQYAYWQTYILYVGYVGVAHLGLLDGIMLRYSQYDYNQLDKARIRSQFQILLFTTTLLAGLAMLISLYFGDQVTRAAIRFVAIGIVTKNLVTYNSHLFQMTNRIDKYSLTTIVNRACYGVFVLILIVKKINRFEFYCIADVLSDIIGIVLSKFYNRGLFFGKALSIHEAFREWAINVSSGIVLMLSNWSALFFSGFAKMIVQWRWDALTFGKISFSFSVSGVFLTFISAVSVVLFPYLKRMNQDRLPQMYMTIRGIISPLLFTIMLAYYPGCYILERFLPKYSQSLTYLGMLLPIVIYSSKVSILTDNYLKAYRKERDMLRVNIISLAISCISYVLSAYVFNSLSALLVCIVIANIIKSIMSEMVVTKEIKSHLSLEYIKEAVLTAAFILYASCFRRRIAFVSYLITLILYLWIGRKDLKRIVRMLV